MPGHGRRARALGAALLPEDQGERPGLESRRSAVTPGRNEVERRLAPPAAVPPLRPAARAQFVTEAWPTQRGTASPRTFAVTTSGRVEPGRIHSSPSVVAVRRGAFTAPVYRLCARRARGAAGQARPAGGRRIEVVPRGRCRARAPSWNRGERLDLRRAAGRRPRSLGQGGYPAGSPPSDRVEALAHARENRPESSKERPGAPRRWQGRGGQEAWPCQRNVGGDLDLEIALPRSTPSLGGTSEAAPGTTPADPGWPRWSSMDGLVE